MKGGLKKKISGAGEEDVGDPSEEKDQMEEEEDGGEEEDEGDEEGDDESDDDGDADFDAQQEEDKEDEDNERPKLDEGFYEIEAVRRKRVRKGQVQYLIKWRGWPETANTWEPLENLMSISDVIDAFEDSLRSGKHRTYRKRKRKSAVPQIQPRKKQNTQQQSSYGSRQVEDGFDDELLTPVPIRTSTSADLPRKVNLAANKPETVQNGALGLRSVDQTEEPDYDPKLSELIGTVRSNGAHMENSARRSQFSEGNRLTNGVLKSDSVEGIRRVGAKRRKSGSVKRFKQEAASGETDGDNARNGAQERAIENNDTMRVAVSVKNSSAKNEPVITKIIKPIGFSSSGTIDDQNVSVTFVVMRSDGKEVVVDNSYLKANNPLLLIDFYEQHLRYNPAPGPS